MARLKDKVALITGGSSGIGAETAELFAREGAKVAIIARRADKGQAVINAVTAAGGEGLFIQGDVSNVDDVNGAVAKTVDAFGKLDVGVNNAGIIGELGPIINMSDDNWKNVLDINLNGIFYAVRAEARAMVEAGGSIVNVASVNSFIGAPMAAAYATSKHAMVGFAKSAVGEFTPMGIRINTVCPGLVETEMQQDVAHKLGVDDYDDFESPFMSRVPMARMADPIEIANTILWLASDEASYCTGATIAPDGGLMA